jgi:hypothetical protein
MGVGVNELRALAFGKRLGSYIKPARDPPNPPRSVVDSGARRSFDRGNWRPRCDPRIRPEHADGIASGAGRAAATIVNKTQADHSMTSSARGARERAATQRPLNTGVRFSVHSRTHYPRSNL